MMDRDPRATYVDGVKEPFGSNKGTQTSDKPKMSEKQAEAELSKMAEGQRRKIIEEFDYEKVPEGMRETARYMLNRGFTLIVSVEDGTVPSEDGETGDVELPVVAVLVPPELMAQYAKHLRSLLFQEHGILVNPSEAEPYPQIAVTYQAHSDTALLELAGVNDAQLKPFEAAPEDKPLILGADARRAN